MDGLFQQPASGLSPGNSPAVLDCGGRRLSLHRPLIMGVINVTPDSFSDGNQFLSCEHALTHGERLVAEGADLLDIGGESTRPAAVSVSVQEELDRVIPVLEALAHRVDIPLSIDTSKPEVMREAVRSGAGLINDVRALQAPGACETAAELGVPVCLMHMQGEPRSMQDAPSYQDVVAEVREFLRQRVAAAGASGIRPQDLLIDPGFGFGKSVDHNLALLRQLPDLASLGPPVLVGLSRKSLIGKLLGRPVDQRVHASVALALLAAQNGARVLRVHDVAATRDALRLWQAVEGLD